jgi:hypothetical protein
LAKVLDHMSHDVCRIIKVSRGRGLLFRSCRWGERGVNFSRRKDLMLSSRIRLGGRDLHFLVLAMSM